MARKILPAAKFRWRFVIGTARAAGLPLCVYADGGSVTRPLESEADRGADRSPGFPIPEPLYALDPDFQPFLFYVRSRLFT